MPTTSSGASVGHMPGTPLTRSFAGVVGHVRGWSVASQQHSRRNAMVASTACAQRRAERLEVDDFFTARSGADDPTNAPGKTAHA